MRIPANNTRTARGTGRHVLGDPQAHVNGMDACIDQIAASEIRVIDPDQILQPTLCIFCEGKFHDLLEIGMQKGPTSGVGIGA